MRLDHQKKASADALRTAAPSLKSIMAAGAGSKQTASRWQRDGDGSPVLAHDLMIHALSQRPGGRPGALIANARTTLLHAHMPLSDADLIKRFWTLMDDECGAQGREDRASSLFALTGDLAALEKSMLDEASIQEEVAAVCRELQRRGIDPRPGRQS